MTRPFAILLLVFLVLLIGKQSHVIKKVNVYDQRMGTQREEYRFEPQNVKKYFLNIRKSIQSQLTQTRRYLKNVFQKK